MILFNDWNSLFRVLIIGVCAYIGLIVILRISGNRTLSKMNSYDFIITIALGSTFASAILDKNVALADALLAFTVLAGLQFITTWLSVRSATVDRLVKADPVLLFWNGQYLTHAMKRAHVTHEEVQAGMRQQGFGSMDEVGSVVLEANGKIVAVEKGELALPPQN